MRMGREVLNHLRDLEENLKDWDSYLQETSLPRFLESRKDRHALLHCALVSLQAAIDIGNHWVAGLTPRRPESYKAIMDLLMEKKAIPARLARDLKGLFSLRNVLIHKYQEPDLEKICAHLRKGVKPLRSFLRLSKARVEGL